MHKSFSCMFISILYMFQTAMCTSSAYAPAYQTVIYMIFVIFVNNQLDAQFFFMYVYFYSLHVSDSYVSIIGRINCINTTSGICHSVSMTVWYAGAYAPAYHTVLYTEWHTRCRIDTVNSPNDGHIAVWNMYRIEINIREREMCLKLVIYKEYIISDSQTVVTKPSPFKLNCIASQ